MEGRWVRQPTGFNAKRITTGTGSNKEVQANGVVAMHGIQPNSKLYYYIFLLSFFLVYVSIFRSSMTQGIVFPFDGLQPGSGYRETLHTCEVPTYMRQQLAAGGHTSLPSVQSRDEHLV